jgi:hypothetical protein
MMANLLKDGPVFANWLPQSAFPLERGRLFSDLARMDRCPACRPLAQSASRPYFMAEKDSAWLGKLNWSTF